jgi:hypothetical protein
MSIPACPAPDFVVIQADFPLVRLKTTFGGLPTSCHPHDFFQGTGLPSKDHEGRQLRRLADTAPHQQLAVPVGLQWLGQGQPSPRIPVRPFGPSPGTEPPSAVLRSAGTRPAGSAPEPQPRLWARTGRDPTGPAPRGWYSPKTPRFGSARLVKPCRCIGGQPQRRGALCSHTRSHRGPAPRRGYQMLTDIEVQFIAHRVGVPIGPAQHILEAIGIGLAADFDLWPAVLALGRTAPAAQVRHSPLAGL